ncbi:Calx-beta domain-containing protein, partial [Dolichospermum sp. UHCC 0352]|uniref:Calx-beta domain-containing protein n=1 Tax=Dolichospermum sp. UHCC 0352 TaxID=2590011 RepID=UPI002738764F
YGGEGSDTAVYSGTYSQYQITSSGGVFTITDSVNNRDGIDTLYGIQKVQFSDQTITITDNDGLPTLSINDVTITEGNSGTTNAVFTVTRSGTASQPITVNYATANGTATAGSDFTNTTGTLTFATNETTKTITILILGDTSVEGNETFFVNLSNATNATIADTQGQGTINNDDVFTPIESAGNTKLVKDATNKYFTQIGTNTPTAIKNGGQQIYENIYAGWQTIAAETVNGDNQVLWKNISGNYLHIWHLDSNWNWVSSQGNWGLNSAEALTQETNF